MPPAPDYARGLCPVERFIGTLERQVTALAGLKLRHAHGHRDRYRLTLEVERTRGNGLTQYFTYGQGIRQGRVGHEQHKLFTPKRAMKSVGRRRLLSTLAMIFKTLSPAK